MDIVNNEKEIIDVTGTPLTPGSFEKCLGNGEHAGIECCCDNCDYFIICVLKSDAKEWQELRQEIIDDPFFAELVKDVIGDEGLDFSKMTLEEFWKATFKEAAEQETKELEAMDIEVLEPTEEQKREIEELLHRKEGNKK